MKKDKENSLGREYVIQFAGLSLGIHEFEFEAGDKFFSHFKGTEIDNGKFNIDLELNKQNNMLVLKFRINGTTNVLCDRCSDPFDLKVEGEQQLIVKLGEEDFGDNDEIIALPYGESEIDVSRYIYEFIVLSLPQKRVHPEVKGKTGCNKEVLKKLEEIALKEEEEKRTDPRWEKLKSLKFKN